MVVGLLLNTSSAFRYKTHWEQLVGSYEASGTRRSPPATYYQVLPVLLHLIPDIS